MNMLLYMRNRGLLSLCLCLTLSIPLSVCLSLEQRACRLSRSHALLVTKCRGSWEGSSTLPVLSRLPERPHVSVLLSHYKHVPLDTCRRGCPESRVLTGRRQMEGLWLFSVCPCAWQGPTCLRRRVPVDLDVTVLRKDEFRVPGSAQSSGDRGRPISLNTQHLMLWPTEILASPAPSGELRRPRTPSPCQTGGSRAWSARWQGQEKTRHASAS